MNKNNIFNEDISKDNCLGMAMFSMVSVNECNKSHTDSKSTRHKHNCFTLLRQNDMWLRVYLPTL